MRKLLPELVILDLSIPEMGGLSVISNLKLIVVSSKVLILTSGDSRNFAILALQADADGFVCKDDNLDELIGAVKAVLSGYNYFPANTIHILRDNSEAATHESIQLSLLSDREITALKLLACGLGNQDVAGQLMVSHKAVSTYKVRLQRKLNVANLIDLVELAKRNGLV
ncbi:response regulator transcription factor [Pseudomonas paralactis]|uniref:response regulator transcription factor n=1 Tax=Pseudomonas paralactis TaxID=1615673 RepID=UPI002FCD84C8